MIIFALIFGGVIFPIALAVFFGLEQHDKAKRQRQGLPPKKYHDITDYDVTTVYTIHHHK